MLLSSLLEDLKKYHLNFWIFQGGKDGGALTEKSLIYTNAISIW